MQIKEALFKGKSILKNSDTDTASLDASLIMSHVTGFSKAGLIIHDEDELSSELQESFFSLIDKRSKGYPVAYILGYKDFWSLRLKVNEHTLIPRSDTETLVEAALSLNVKGDVLDLGTGSGAIILALKKELRDSINAYACDISEDTLNVAEINAKENNLEVKFFISDWFNDVPEKKYALIVSNPPYIEEDDEHLGRSSLPYEPSRALASGPDGLNDIKTIAYKARFYLAFGAYLIVEHGYNHGAAVQEIFSDLGYEDVQTLKDLEGRDRITMGAFFGK